MGKKKHYNYRAEQARKRNEEQAEMNRKAKARKEFWEKYRKHIIIGAIALVVAILLFNFISMIAGGVDGQLPHWFGNLTATVEPNWIVTDLNDAKTGMPRYYKLAEFDTPEGFTLNESFTASPDAQGQALYFEADSDTSPIAYIYVSGVSNKTASEQAAAAASYGYYKNTTQALIEMGGRQVHYAYYQFESSSEEEAIATGTSGLNLYVDTVNGSCVVISMNSPTRELGRLPSEEELLALAEQYLALLTLPND